MCGIIGYTGFQPAIPVLMQGLRSLEYRGYDSGGIAFSEKGVFTLIKAAGKLDKLEEKIKKYYHSQTMCGIGHTRWATHGPPTEENAHPHTDNKNKIAVVHNGIIENFAELKEFLAPFDVTYSSQTDTEVLTNFIAWHLENCENNLDKALQLALPKVKGAYALVIMSLEEEGVLRAVRQAGPLLLGVGQGEYFIASDAPAFLPYTKKVAFIKEGELVTCTRDGYTVKNLTDFAPIEKEEVTLQWDMQAAQKDGYKHFMLKEIFEQPKVLHDCLRGRIEGQKIILPELKDFKRPERINILACGTSYYAGLWGKEIIEELAGIAVNVELASEIAFRKAVFLKNDAVLCISQSGETADTLAALQKAKQNKVPTIALCNVLGSSLAREADAVIYTQAGPEVSVASTKAMMSQLILLFLIALHYAQEKEETSDKVALDTRINEYISFLLQLPNLLEDTLPLLSKQAKALANEYNEEKHFFFLGRGYQYPLALEGALKLKELSYIHAEGYASGEMKHGPIALIDSEFPSFVLAPMNELFQKVRSNVEVVQARKGRTLILTNEDAPITGTHLWYLPINNLPEPLSSFLILPALQLFAYQMAALQGHDVDQPRNLAKSVTVE